MTELNRTEEIEFLADDFEWADKGEDLNQQEIFVRESSIKQFITKFSKNKGSVFGLIFIIIIIFFALFGPYMNDFGSNEQIIGNESMAPRVPGLEQIGVLDGTQTLKSSTGEIELNKYESNPNAQDTYYWFGSDVLGRDIFTRTWEGTRISLYIALVAVIVDVLIGMTYGLISGFLVEKSIWLCNEYWKCSMVFLVWLL